MAALDALELDEEVRAVIITGSGRAFSAGADIKGFLPHMRMGPRAAVAHFLRPGQRLTARVEAYPKPIIAAVNGLAFGGGCELVEATHIAVAAASAVFSKAEINIGIIPTFGGTQRLPRNIGRKAATELILTGRRFGAEEALRLGLVNRVVADEALMPAALGLAREIAAKPPSRSPRRCRPSIAARTWQSTAASRSKRRLSRRSCRRAMPSRGPRPSSRSGRHISSDAEATRRWNMSAMLTYLWKPGRLCHGMVAEVHRPITHKLPPLSALRVFEAAGRRGGFTAAAAELGVTPSAVSHGVRTLEDALGVPLFHRDQRGMRLTPGGEKLLREASRAFEGLARCVESLTESTTRRRLNGSVAPTFATGWLLPRLLDLRRQYPSVDLAISTEREHVELGDGRFDFAIRMAAAPVGPAEWHRLAPVGLVPVAAPIAGCRCPKRSAPAGHHVTAAGEDWAAWAPLAACRRPIRRVGSARHGAACAERRRARPRPRPGTATGLRR